MTISGFSKWMTGLIPLVGISCGTNGGKSEKNLPATPNIILIIADDLGFGDLGINGNPHVKTPVLDRFARESIRFDQFYVSPVSAPTRASLMTGRYSLRTGVRDTFNGGAIMATGEITIAEMLKKVGYYTGIFGKWHLGDNYPCRPGDQGFDESLIHLSGGMGQPGDFTTFFEGDSSYFNPVLWYNGKPKRFSGYCSDIFAGEAIGFIEKNHTSPFFCYLSFNAPHTPLQVPEEYYSIYKDLDPRAGFGVDSLWFSGMNSENREAARRVYAMVSNIDDNVGKLLQKLDDLNIAENTLVVFMTDNGPEQKRYVGGMRGRKGSVYRGGVRVPFYLRLPGRFKGNRIIETPAAHIDILPTLADLCRTGIPDDRVIDGKSLFPLLNSENGDVFEERPLFFYWTRRFPELYNNIALQKGPYRLVGNTAYNASPGDFELYNFRKDGHEQHNIVQSEVLKASEMKTDLDRMLSDLTSSRHLIDPPRIIIGSAHENPVVLNRNDAGGEPGIWHQEEVFGMWKVKILEGHYNIRIRFIKPLKTPGKIEIETNSSIIQKENRICPTDIIELNNVYFREMTCDLIPRYVTGGRRIFPLWVEMERTGN